MKFSMQLSEETKPSLVLLVLANLVPLFMVFYEGWSVGEVLMVFWLENVVIGFYNVLRMVFCGKKHAGYSKPFIIPFFVIHYGMFTMGHGIMIYEFFVQDQPQQVEQTTQLTDIQEDQSPAEPEVDKVPFGPEMVPYLVKKLDLWWPLLALMGSHGFSFVWHYLRGGEYRQSRVGELMGRPYGRVILLHITVLIGGFLVQAIGAPIIALVLLIGMKILVDSALHLNSHKGTHAVAVN